MDDNTVTTSESLSVSELSTNKAYRLTSPNLNDGYLKWVETDTSSQSSEDNQLGVRSDPGDWSSDYTNQTIWTLVQTLDSSNGYSIQSSYDTNYYIYASAYNDDDDTDIGHVYNQSDSTNDEQFSLSISDASTLDSTITTGIIIYYTNSNTNYYMIGKDHIVNTETKKDIYFMPSTHSSFNSNHAIFYITEN